MQLPARRLLNIIFTIMVDSAGEVNRGEVIMNLDAFLRDADLPDRERWGTDPAYVQQQRGIMAQYGPPPGWTPKPKDQPA